MWGLPRLIEVVSEMYDELLGLFRIRNPDLEALPIGINALVEAIPRIYVALGGRGC